jgi:hypothetical protein
MIPSTIHPSVRSGGERRLFEVLRDAPNTDDWVCLHSLGLARHHTKRRGEIDFLVFTRKGVFVLEVKGGRVARRDGGWVFTDKYGVPHIKQEGPFEQASSAMFALEADIRKRFGDDSRLAKLLFGYGVMFPDIQFDFAGCEADRQLVYDLRDRRQPITTFFGRLTQFTQARQPAARFAPTESDIKQLVEFLRGDFDLVPPLSVQVSDAAERLVALTQEQHYVLDALDDEPRCLVQGGAGTGKTLLAVEAARREFRLGKRVLLLCFNRNLAGYLKAALAKERSKGEVLVATIHQFMEQLIRRSSVFGDFQRRRASAGDEELFTRLYPEYAQLATLEPSFVPFDAAIIDEAQDMMTEGVLDVIDGCLVGGLEGGRWRAFYDANNQAAVYGVFEPAALERMKRFGRTSILTLNCRNTKQIADETAMLAAPRVAARAKTEGIPVQYAWYDSPQEQSAKLRQILRRLTSEGITLGRITILSPHGAERCVAAQLPDLPASQVAVENAAQVCAGSGDALTICSISSFKGLENDFIIVTDIDELSADWWRAVVYVGMSRARVGLILLLNSKLKPIYEDRLRQWMAQTLGEADARAAEGKRP